MAKITQVLRKIIITIVIAPIKFYRLLISPMLGQNCRFTPSCSQYAITAIENHGVIKGAWLASKRIIKCHPYNQGGLDPVPDNLKPQAKEK